MSKVLSSGFEPDLCGCKGGGEGGRAVPPQERRVLPRGTRIPHDHQGGHLSSPV